MNAAHLNRAKNHAKNLALAMALLSFTISLAAQQPNHARDQSSQASTVTTINDIFAEVGRRVPGFGGMFVDEDKDTLYVYLVPGEVGDVPQVDQAITDVFGSARPPGHQLEVLEGRYTFLQLKAWLDEMTPRILGMSGTVLTSIDQGKNRLRVGVETLALAPAVEAELTAMGIPLEAVNIEQASPAKFPETLPNQLAPVAMTLRDKFRPVVGGLQIKISTTMRDASAKQCTLGFLATRKNVPGFVINSHCVFGGPLMGNKVYQPAVSKTTQVGQATFDPPAFKNKQDPKCPPLKVCRYSDSAFVKLDNPDDGMLGFIAQPEVKSDEWDGVKKFRIVDRAVSTKGMKVTRVSSQSGRWEGEVVDPCENKKSNTDNVTYLCQTIVSSAHDVDAGDSGSPVFTINTPPAAEDKIVDVKLLGILWGTVSGDDTMWIVSPIQNIEMLKTELGPLKVCDPRVGC